MRTRLAIISVLAMGILMTGGGATLAFQGAAGSGDAGEAQYEELPPAITPQEESGGEEGAGGDGEELAGPGGSTQDTLGGGDEGSGSEGTQAPEQSAAAGDDSGSALPFTGFFTIPMMLVGLALLLTGAVLQRRSRETA